MSGRSVKRTRREFRKLLDSKTKEMREESLNQFFKFLSTQSFWSRAVILIKILFAK